MSTTIQVSLIFIKVEKNADYIWSLIILQEALKEYLLPEFMLTGHELELINAVAKFFTTKSFFLRTCYININDVQACKKYFSANKILTEFYSAGKKFLNFINISKYESA